MPKSTKAKKPLEFAPETSGMDMHKLPADHPECRVRNLTYSGVDEFKRSIKTEDNIEILREALRRELDGSPRTSIVKPLRTKIKKLKADEAAKVEVVEIKDTLDDCGKGIEIASSRIEKEYARYDRITKYDRVLIGLWLLKAKHLHLIPTVGTRSRRDEKTGQLKAASGGFLDWLKEHAPHLKQATAYNYQYAALNAGLTIESTEADVAKLKKAKALDGTPIKQLYAPPSDDNIEDEEEEEPEETQSKFVLIRDTLVKTRQECDALINVKDDMTPAAHETACARLVRTLEELTGSKWGVTDAENAAQLTEHPQAYELGS